MKQTEKWWGEKYAREHESDETAAFLLDKAFCLVWVNTVGKLLLDKTDVGEKPVFLKSFSTIFDKIPENSQIILSVKIEGAKRSFICRDICENGERRGFAVASYTVNSDITEPTMEDTGRMLTSFTHQMRGPLSVIFSALSGISRCNDELGDPSIYEYINKISLQSFRMLRTVTNLTEMQSYESKTSSYAPKKQNLAMFLEQLCRVVSVRMESIGIRFYFSVPGDTVPVSFDADKIATVLLNLFSNSAKFIGERGEIFVGLTFVEGYAAITVDDNGIGMDEDALRRVFEPYYSYNPATRSVCGDGQGLTLCREIILEHGGLIFINSRVGAGTRAEFLLPLCTEDDHTELTMCDVANSYMCNRFSKMYVILSDVCPPPEL